MKIRFGYAVVFGGLALATFLIGSNQTSRTIQAPTLWFSINLLILSVAYLFDLPQIFGKSANGKLNLLLQMIMLPWLIFSWSIWYLQILISSEESSHQITEQFTLGRRPIANELPQQIDVVIDLTAEFPSIALSPHTQLICLPTLDATTPSDQELFQLIDFVTAHQQLHYYVHCANGHGRSAIALAAIFIALNPTLEVENAINLIASKRCHIKPNSTQIVWLKSIHSQLQKRSP